MSPSTSPPAAPSADAVHTGRTDTGPIRAPDGLKGVIVADTEIGDVRGDAGTYHYRGHPAIELAEHRSFEDVWHLVVDGELPADAGTSGRVADEIRAGRRLPPEVAELLPGIAVRGAPLEALRTSLSLVAAVRGVRPLHDLDHAARRADLLGLAAAVPTLVAAIHRIRRGREPVEPRDDLGHAADYLRMLTGQTPDPVHERALERYLVATVDHGFNASTFAARVVASTGADAGACLVAALGALSGPLHGGAPSRALDLLDRVERAEDVDDVVRPMLDRGERIMGFGHAVYRTDDPRSVLLRRVAHELAAHDPARAGDLVSRAEALEAGVVDLLAAHKPGRDLRANVELYAGVVMHLCGIDRDVFTPTFVVARSVGWGAHVLEQAATGRLIRPSSRYVGVEPPRPVVTVPAPPAAVG